MNLFNWLLILIFRLEKLKISISDEDIKTSDKRVLLLDLNEVNSDFSYRPSAESWALDCEMESLVISGLKNKTSTPQIVSSVQVRTMFIASFFPKPLDNMIFANHYWSKILVSFRFFL